MTTVILLAIIFVGALLVILAVRALATLTASDHELEELSRRWKD